MASKKAKQKKVLDKAKQLVLKNKKGKAKAKPKQSYPEGQNAPQSKAYRIDNDKTQVAKATGWRFTKEGAKRLGKTESDRPTQAEIEKYRNQTFKVKGKVNKSGPKGTGDGSFRYIYIERRADKADLKRNQKLAKGGKVQEFEIYDDETGKTLVFKARSYEEAEGISATIDFNDYEDGDVVDVLDEMDSYNSMENEYAKGGSIDDKRERVIDYYLNNDVFDDYDTYGLTEQDLMDAKKSKSYKKIEDAIVKYHGLDDDDNVEERFETLGLEDEGAIESGEIKDWDDYEVIRFIKEDLDEYYDDDEDYFQRASEIGLKYDNKKKTWSGYLSGYLPFAKGGETKNAWGVYYNGKLMFKESSEQDAHKSAKMLKSEVDMPFAVSVEKIDDEYAKGGKTKNLPTKQEFREFQEYVFSFYGKGGLHADAFDGGATTEEILLATNQYLTFCARNTDLWGGGDTADREYVRDIMLYHRGVDIDDLFYENLIKKIKKTTILEYGGILQPMIGGVNADPRFDIYNTTMFAEDGAMLDDGKKMRRGGFVTTMDDLIASADLIAEAEAKMKEGDADKVLNFAYTDYGGDFFDKVAIEYFEENYPDNIVVENTMYSGKNAIVFGEPAREFAEASERYLLGFDNIEDYYYQMQYEQEREDFERFLEDMEKYNNYKVSPEAINWLMENKSGYYTILPSGLDYSESDLEEELVNEGLLEKNEEMAKGGETKIYDVTTRRKGENAMFSSSFRAKSKEDALRMYKERAKKYGDTRYEVVDVFETSRKRLEQGGENEQ